MCCLFCLIPIKIMKTLFLCAVITIFVTSNLFQLCAGVTFWLSYEVKSHPLTVMLGIGYYIMGLFILVGGLVFLMAVCGVISSICCRFSVLCVPFVSMYKLQFTILSCVFVPLFFIVGVFLIAINIIIKDTINASCGKGTSSTYNITAVK